MLLLILPHSIYAKIIYSMTNHNRIIFDVSGSHGNKNASVSTETESVNIRSRGASLKDSSEIAVLKVWVMFSR